MAILEERLSSICKAAYNSVASDSRNYIKWFGKAAICSLFSSVERLTAFFQLRLVYLSRRTSRISSGKWSTFSVLGHPRRSQLKVASCPFSCPGSPQWQITNGFSPLQRAITS